MAKKFVVGQIGCGNFAMDQHGPNAGEQGGLQGYLEKRLAQFQGLTNIKEARSSVQTNHGYKERFDGFVDAILDDTPTPCDEMAGYRATYLAETAMKSIEVNHPLPIPVEKWDYFVNL